MPNPYPVLSLLKHINAKRSTAGPPIKLFRCNAEEKKKKLIHGRGHCLCGVCTFSSCLHKCSLSTQFPPTSQRCACEMACLNCLSLNECV